MDYSKEVPKEDGKTKPISEKVINYPDFVELHNFELTDEKEKYNDLDS